MIEEKDGVVTVTGYAFAVGKIPYRLPHWLFPKRIKNALRLIADTDGLVGVAPIGDRTLLIYETENDAKRARNIANSRGILCGKEIFPIETFAERTENRYI